MHGFVLGQLTLQRDRLTFFVWHLQRATLDLIGVSRLSELINHLNRTKLSFLLLVSLRLTFHTRIVFVLILLFAVDTGLVGRFRTCSVYWSLGGLIEASCASDSLEGVDAELGMARFGKFYHVLDALCLFPLLPKLSGGDGAFNGFEFFGKV